MTEARLTPLNALLLAAWLGAALLTAAVVAPAAFAVLPTRALAGALVGRVLPVLFVSGALLGALTVALALGQEAPGRWRNLSGAVMLLASGAAQGVIAPRIARVREAIGPTLEALAADDPRREAFGRLHGLSVLCLGVAMVAALAAVLLLVLPARGART